MPIQDYCVSKQMLGCGGGPIAESVFMINLQLVFGEAEPYAGSDQASHALQKYNWPQILLRVALCCGTSTGLLLGLFQT